PEFTKRNAITFLFWKDEPKFTNLFFIQRNLTDDPGDFVLRLESGELVKSVGELVDGSKLSTISSPSFFLNEIDGDEKVRIFHFRVARTSLHQNITPEVTGSAVYTGSRELTVNPREPVVHEASSGGNPNEVFRQIGQTFEARSNEVVIESPVEISEQQTLLVSGNQNWLFGPSGCLTIKGKLEFAPNASLRLAGVDGQRWQGVHFHNAPDTVFKNVTIEHIGTGDEFVRCGSREYTGGVSFHDMTVSLSNIEVRDSQVEDTLHFLRSKVKVDHLKIVVAQGDAVDADFSDLIVTGADISGSKGDALDVSGSYLSVSDSYLHDNADKNLSVGENSRVRILNARFERGRFGVAIKDSSNVEVDHSKFVGNEYALGQFVKKPFFIFPEVKVGADVVFIDNGQDRKEFSFQDAMKLY
ncbi:MAG: right-handed parallel beta-helix repeat-containing protein, partial [Bdellovibrionales bacterium]|nr:right-handed parallel beta-helix repeat-containing protein [Bdellovibrionales bacterium]